MFEDLNLNIDDYYELSDSAQKELLLKIHKRAIKDRDGFQRIVNRTEFGYDSFIDIFYEAISIKPAGFEDWLLTEQKRIIEACESGEEAPLHSLSAFHFLISPEIDNKLFYQKALTFLFSKLNSPIWNIRTECAEAISDIIYFEKIKLKQKELESLSETK